MVVTGGLGDGTVNIEEVPKKDFEEKYPEVTYKPPLLNNSTTEYCLPDSMKDHELEGGEAEEEKEDGKEVAQIEN